MEIKLPPSAERYLAYAEMERFTEQMRFFAEACCLPAEEEDPGGEPVVADGMRLLLRLAGIGRPPAP
jgi:hypothetical protein